MAQLNTSLIKARTNIEAWLAKVYKKSLHVVCPTQLPPPESLHWVKHSRKRSTCTQNEHHVKHIQSFSTRRWSHYNMGKLTDIDLLWCQHIRETVVELCVNSGGAWTAWGQQKDSYQWKALPCKPSANCRMRVPPIDGLSYFVVVSR